MNGNNGNNGNNGHGRNHHGHHSGWHRVNQNQQGPMNGPFGNSNGRGGRNPHGNGVDSIFDLFFHMIGLSIEITFKALEVVFDVIGEVLGGKSRSGNHHQNPFGGNPTGNSNNQYEYKTSDSSNESETGNGNRAESYSNYGNKEVKREARREERYEAKEARRSEKETRRNERMKEKYNPGEPESKLTAIRKDGLLGIFLLMTIPLIVFIAMKELLVAGGILGAGVLTMTVFSTVMASAIKRESKKPVEDSIEEEGDEAPTNDIEKVMEASFDKIFEIRKDMILIPDGVVKEKIESICAISEKIIGEVRTNPELYPQSKRFFYYHLESFNEIFNKYVKLLNYREDSQETNRTLFETEKAFGNIESIFREILTKVLERDLINLKAEINVMKNSN